MIVARVAILQLLTPDELVMAKEDYWSSDLIRDKIIHAVIVVKKINRAEVKRHARQKR